MSVAFLLKSRVHNLHAKHSTFCLHMPVTPLQQATRALVTLLLSLASGYQIVLAVTRESPDAEIKKAVRKVAAKVHPDKGGSKDDMQRLLTARDHWICLASSRRASAKGPASKALNGTGNGALGARANC